MAAEQVLSVNDLEVGDTYEDDDGIVMNVISKETKPNGVVVVMSVGRGESE